MTESAPLILGTITQEAFVLGLTGVAAIWIGIATFRLGVRTINEQRAIAATRLTFETVHGNNWDRDYIEKRIEFIKLRDCGDGLALYAKPSSDRATDTEKAQHNKNASTIRAILNDYETIAIGIRRGILDEEFLYRYMRSPLVRDWVAASPYVVTLRADYGIPQIYVEFE
ncbi:DUF4760 domain-containing protein, partial [Methyloceanibacter sp.]|uniref:DUF4760 domain-containing protein n=1 Tax=Methyloceanibacter sp. TaxID=1965321 RepID=UPI002D4958B4